MLKEAAIDGLLLAAPPAAAARAAQLVDLAEFEERDGKMIAHAPKTNPPIPQERYRYIRELIESGLRHHGFTDEVTVRK